MMVRHCILCPREITECMGAVLPRDLCAYWDGKINAEEIREICGYCWPKWDYKSWPDPRVIADPHYLIQGTGVPSRTGVLFL